MVDPESHGFVKNFGLSSTLCYNEYPFSTQPAIFLSRESIYCFDKSPSLNHFLWWAFDGSSSGFFVWRKPSRRTSRAAPCWRRRPELRRRPDCLWRSTWPSFRPRNWRRRRAPLGAWRPGKRHQIPPPHPLHLPAAGCMKVPPHTPVAKISSGSVMKSGTLPTERFWYRASFRATQIFIALLLTRPAETESCSAGDSCLKLPESFC